MKKKCFKCKQFKEYTEFFTRRKGKLQPYCKDCKRIYDRIYHKRRSIEAKKAKLDKQRLRLNKIREWVCDYLKYERCADCGLGDVIVLTFDHLESKKATISAMIRNGYSIESLKKEINKCEVVCANCHMRRTAKRADWYKFNY